MKKNHPQISSFFVSLTAAFAWSCMSLQAIAQHQHQMPDPLAGLTRQEKKELQQQASNFYNVSRKSVEQAARSTVTLYYKNSMICYGTVVTSAVDTEPVILTKWSEVKNIRDHIVAVTSEGKALATSLAGFYPDHDLAIFRSENNTNRLNPVKLWKSKPMGLGSFILLASPDGDVGSLGVVSVAARSLRDGDKAYLGVMMDFDKEESGVPLKQIMPGSAAAKAGLRQGDIILAVGQENLSGAMEMRTLLQRLQPGSNIDVTYQRGKQRRKTKVKLGSLSENSSIRRIPQERMNTMERMGAIPSRIRTDFPKVVQSDMPIHPTDTGAPVTNLDGEIAGIVIARGSRIKTYIIPADTIKELLSKPPVAPLSAHLDRNTNSRLRSRAKAEDPLDQVKRLLGLSRPARDKNP